MLMEMGKAYWLVDIFFNDVFTVYMREIERQTDRQRYRETERRWKRERTMCGYVYV